MSQIPRHKVFISFHERDRQWRDYFVTALGGGIVDKSVHEEDIDDDPLKTETVRQKIRDEFIADATVTVVLVGPCTWQRKFVDWEIGSSLQNTRKNPRCGLVGFLLPHHPDHGTGQWHHRLVPPRLCDNARQENGFAEIMDWHPRGSVNAVLESIDRAFKRRHVRNPKNNRPQFGKNRSGPCQAGWQDG